MRGLSTMKKNKFVTKTLMSRAGNRMNWMTRKKVGTTTNSTNSMTGLKKNSTSGMTSCCSTTCSCRHHRRAPKFQPIPANNSTMQTTYAQAKLEFTGAT